MESHALKDLIEKKDITPPAKREAVDHLMTEHRLTVRRACASVPLRLLHKEGHWNQRQLIKLTRAGQAHETS